MLAVLSLYWLSVIPIVKVRWMTMLFICLCNVQFGILSRTFPFITGHLRDGHCVLLPEPRDRQLVGWSNVLSDRRTATTGSKIQVSNAAVLSTLYAY